MKARVSGNVGREAVHDSIEERYQRILQENRELKIQRNELQEKLKDLTTKFRKLTRDLVATGVDVETVMSKDYPSVAVLSKGSLLNSTASTVDKNAEANKVSALLAEREALQNQLKALSADGGGSIKLAQELVQLRNERMEDYRKLEQYRSEIQRLQSSLQQEMNLRMQLQSTSHANNNLSHEVHIQAASQQLQNAQQTLAHNAALIEGLVRERDSLKLQLRIAQEQTSTFQEQVQQVDPMSLLQLQQHIHEKTSEVARGVG